METVQFYNGRTMPKIGLGTYRVKDGDECRESVKYAIEQGYRSIDTAMIYGNEETVGQGIKEGLESTGLRDRKSTRLNSSHRIASRMPSSA